MPCLELVATGDQRVPLPLQPIDEAPQPIEARAIRAPVEDAQHQGARLHPCADGRRVRNRGDVAVNGRAQGDQVRIDQRLGTGGPEEGAHRQKAGGEHNRQADQHLEQMASSQRAQQPRGLRAGFAAVRQARPREGVPERGQAPGDVEARPALGFGLAARAGHPDERELRHAAPLGGALGPSVAYV